MSETLPISIDVRITGKCDLKCNYCFGTSCTQNELDFHMWQDLLNEFYRYNVRCLIVTGGEPTTRDDLLDFLEYAKLKGFFIILSSNGLNKNLIKFCKFIDVLSLPIDGSDFKQCRLVRNITEEDFSQVISNMKLFKRTYPSKLLKIGTVVSQKNMHNINNIFDIIFNVADVWKLYQVSKHQKNESIFKTELEVSESQFIDIGKGIIDRYHDKIKICLYKNRDRNGKYLFCEPNGDAMVIYNGDEYIIGNFIDSFDKVLKSWSRYVRRNLLEENLLDTYSFKN